MATASASTAAPNLAADPVPPESRAVSAPALLAFIYLALPNVIFLAGWMRPWAAAIGMLGLAGALAPLLERKWRREASRFTEAWSRVLALLAVAVAWSALGGAGHLFYANTDWITRDAVLHDLVLGDWPVRYAVDDRSGLLLRAPIAYYLPAALLGKFLGHSFADPLLLVWTALGVWILLMLVVGHDDSPRIVAGKVVVVVFFSGMDIVGMVLAAEQVSMTSHLEWWAGLFQYSSHTTQLFWVPGHALPGWIAAALLYRQWERRQLTRLLPAVVALIPLWSPLTALGVVPLALAAVAERVRRQGWSEAVSLRALAGAAVLAGLVGAFITADIGGGGEGQKIRSGWIWNFEPDLAALFARFLLFSLLEYLLLLGLLLTGRTPLALKVSGAVLVLLPLYMFGPGNDFVMRASIAPLMVLAIALSDAAPRLLGSGAPVRLRVLFITLLLFGGVTPITEMSRALVKPSWQPDPSRSVADLNAGSHYLADAANSRLVNLLRSDSAPRPPWKKP